MAQTPGSEAKRPLFDVVEVDESFFNPIGSSHKCMHDSGMISPITRRPQDEE